MLTIPFVQGNKETVFQQLHSLAISEKMAKKFFGDQKDIIGKTLKVDNKEEYVIGAVFKDLPQNSSIKFDWLSPFKIYHDKNEWLNQWDNNGIQTFVELEEKADRGLINKKLDNYLKAKDTTIVAQPFLFSMNDWRLHSKFEEGKQIGGRIQNVRTFSIIAWIILLIACINFMNLATARSEKRAREVGVRKVLGAGKKILIAQFIGEAMVMALLSLLIAVAIIYFILPSFNTLVEKHLQIGLDNPLHLLSLLLIGLICGLVAGSYPALYLSSFNPVWVFKGINLKGSGAAYIRKGLVVLQFTISIILIIGTIIVYNQIQHIKNRDLGYNKDNVIQTGLRGDMQKNFAVIKNQLLSSGYVENVAMSNLNQLYMGSSTGNFEWEGKDPSKKVLVTQDFISPEYIKTMGIQMAKGRDFYPDAKQDSSNVIVNEAFAKIIGKDNVVGTLLRQDTTKYTIVGVIKDFVFDDMYGKSDPLIFRSYPEYFGYMYIRLKSQANVERAVDKIQTVVKTNNPGYPFDYIFVDDEFDRQFKSEMLIGKLSRIFALLAIVITCLGLFGLAAYTAERRTKEIGVRKVLGASIANITRIINTEFFVILLLASIVGSVLSYFAVDLLMDSIWDYYQSTTTQTFIVSITIMFIVSAAVIGYKVFSAASLNPVNTLRDE